jgi:Mu transposase, C-terminal
MKPGNRVFHSGNSRTVAVNSTPKGKTNVMNSPSLFTAAQYARALGCSKQNIHRRLHNVPADSEHPISGNVAKAWKLSSLPADIFDRLNEIKEAFRYRSIADLLSDPASGQTIGRRQPSIKLTMSRARERSLELLADAFESVGEVETLTVEQRCYIWMKACDELQFTVDLLPRRLRGQAIALRKTKRSILGVLLRSSLFGQDKETIRRNLNRQWTRYLANNGKLTDGRSVRDQRKKLSECDDLKLTARALDCGGRVGQAFRELRENGELTSETLSATIDNPAHKSYVPERIRRQITPKVKRLLPLHHGPREHQLRGAYNVRDYSGLFAGDSYQADDVTCPVYYWEYDSAARFGFRIVRGQALLMIDERSRRVLGFALHSERNYNARIIRALITRVHDGFGLPRRRFYFEGGIWRSAKILTGSDELSFDHTELGLREFGIRFVHAKLPRAKVIERVLGILQNSMERLPGYCGRDEIHDCFERVQEQKRLCENGHAQPAKYFLHKSEWEDVLLGICDKHNGGRQGGILAGLSPNEAWNRFQGEDPLVHLGHQGRYLLAHHKLTMKVQRGGITLRPSLGGGTYCNENTGQLVGERVLVWINPEDLSSIAITSAGRCNDPFVVPRLEPIPAIDATGEQFARNASQIAAHNGAAVTSYRLISPHLVSRPFRRTRIDESTKVLGEQIERGATEVKKQKQRARANLRAIAERSRELGIAVPVKRSKDLDRLAAGLELMAQSKRLREQGKEQSL